LWTAERSDNRADARAAASNGSGDADDPSLLTRVKQGDEAALGALLERYGTNILNIGYRVLRDPGEAQELVQEVFLQVYRKCHLYDPQKGSFRCWLVQIAAHRAFDRREYLNLHRFYDDRNLDDFVDVIRSGCNLEYQAEVSETQSELRQALNELSDKQRATLELYFFEGYTLREVSERLNESLGNVRHYYYRALERLKSRVRNPYERNL
jgi:RNA polymerase sigma-70 factor (ECF subfamily)